jgi:hypothetical protein
MTNVYVMKVKMVIALAAIIIWACNRKANSTSDVDRSAVNQADTSRHSTTSIGASAASSTKSVDAMPECIRQKIDSIKKESVQNPPTQINEYEYGGRKIYLFSAPCCDFFSVAVDTDCNNICAPYGGFTGKGDGKCEDFPSKAKHIGLVWKDERGGK